MRSAILAFLAVSSSLSGVPAFGQSDLPVLPLASPQQRVIVPATMGVIVNGNDPQSVELGTRYAELRGIPPSNIITLALPRVNYIARHLFVREIAKLQSAPAYPGLAAYTLAFDKPYRVDSNQSITSAFSQGIETMSWKGNCNVTPRNADAGAAAGASLQARPSMLLYGGGGASDSLALAERGAAADMTDPEGTVFLVKTGDKARSGPREASMDRTSAELANEVAISVVKAQTLSGKTDVLAYQTGLAVLKDLETLRFRPGAYADHLTSYGGAIADERHQTPITALIRAGATASFGTVREPCNFPGKFPDPVRVLSNYLRGDSILEAYWKSIDMMTEGLLVGEPLARPFPVADAKLKGSTVTLIANRHSRSYLEEREAIGNKDGGEGIVQFGLYAVESGTPQFLAEFSYARSMKPGDEIGQVNLGPSNHSKIMLAIMPLPTGAGPRPGNGG